MLSRRIAEKILLAALATGGDFAEIFVENRFNNSIRMVKGEVEKANSGRDYGIGIRIFHDTNVIYAYTNDDKEENLIKVASEAARALKGEVRKKCLAFNIKKINNNHPIKIYPEKKTQMEKVELLREAHHVAVDYDDLIDQVIINYFDSVQNILVANSNGLFIEDERVRTRTGIFAIAARDNEKQMGSSQPGAHMGYEFYDSIDLKKHAEEAARMAVTMINSDHAPGGKMPVIIDNSMGGVIFHEACGHGLEATSVAKNTSVFADKMGKKIASDIVTAIDDGTIANAWGSQNIDDEGLPTRKNVLIKDGILKGFLVDRLNSRRMNMEPTGSGRRESYRYAPTSRMTNTYIANGDSTKEEIIKNTEFGLYARQMGGGSVNPATGEFNFNVQEGYLIRNGEIAKPVRGATLIGKGSEILKKIDMVGNNLEFGQGMCGSISGSIPANVGQPTIRVSELTVGGRKEGKNGSK